MGLAGTLAILLKEGLISLSLELFSPLLASSFIDEQADFTMSTRLSDAKQALTSKRSFLSFIETKESRLGHLEHRNPWTNSDLDISPPEDWTWTWRNYAAFWWSYGFSTGVWTVGSSLIAVGLKSWQGKSNLILRSARFYRILTR